MTKWIGTMLYLISGLGLYPIQMQRLHQNHNYILYISSKRRTHTKTSSNLEPCGSKSESPIPKLHRLSMVFPLRMVDSQSFFPEVSTNETSIIIKVYINLNKKELSYWKKIYVPPPPTSYSLVIGWVRLPSHWGQAPLRLSSFQPSSQTGSQWRSDRRNHVWWRLAGDADDCRYERCDGRQLNPMKQMNTTTWTFKSGCQLNPKGWWIDTF